MTTSLGREEDEVQDRSYSKCEEKLKNSPFRKPVGPLSIEQRRACKSSCATARHRQRRRVLQSCIRTSRAAAELLNTISKFPDRAGEARDPVSAYSQVQMTEAPRWMTLPEEECLEIWTRISWRQRPKGWDKMIEDPVASLEENIYGHPWARFLWARKPRTCYLKSHGEKYRHGNVFTCTKSSFVVVDLRGRYQKWSEKKQIFKTM